MTQQLIGRHKLLKDLNVRAVYQQLTRHGPQSRTELADKLELSQASVGRFVDLLLSANLLREGERIASKAGRRQTLVDINPDAAVIAALTIRSRRIRLLLSDLQGQPLTQTSTDRQARSATELVAQSVALIQKTHAELGINAALGAVVIGLSAAWHPQAQQVYAAPQLAEIEGVNIQQLFESNLQADVMPGTIDVGNDINFAALGEMHYGAAQQVKNFVYINLGSGVGGAAVIDGKLHTGAHGFAGELGYLPIFKEGELRSLESLIGRNAIVHYTQEAGLGSSEQDFFNAFEAQHPGALRIANEISQYLAVAICTITSTLNPDLVVLGGSIGQYSHYFIPTIETLLAPLVPVMPVLASTQLGRDAGLRGAIVHGQALAGEAFITKELSR